MPVPVRRDPTLTQLFSQPLGFLGHWNIGLGNGAAIVGNRDNTTLVKYGVDTNQANRIWAECLPQGIGTCCRKYTLGDGKVVLRDGNNDPTKIFSKTFGPVQAQNVGRDWLIGTLPPDLKVYVRKTSIDNYQLHVHNRNEYKLMLRPFRWSKWSWNLSICQHPESGYMAVVDTFNQSLDIYNLWGKYMLYLFIKYSWGFTWVKVTG